MAQSAAAYSAELAAAIERSEPPRLRSERQPWRQRGAARAEQGGGRGGGPVTH